MANPPSKLPALVHSMTRLCTILLECAPCITCDKYAQTLHVHVFLARAVEMRGSDWRLVGTNEMLDIFIMILNWRGLIIVEFPTLLRLLVVLLGHFKAGYCVTGSGFMSLSCTYYLAATAKKIRCVFRPAEILRSHRCITDQCPSTTQCHTKAHRWHSEAGQG